MEKFDCSKTHGGCVWECGTCGNHVCGACAQKNSGFCPLCRGRLYPADN